MIIMDDAYKLKDFGLIPLQDHVHPMTPEIQEKTMSIPGMAGVWDFGSELRRKMFDIPVGIVEYDRLIMQQKLNAFVVFLFDSYGKPREVKLSFEYEPDKFYKVKVNSMITPERMIQASRFNLPFVAYDPFKYSNVHADEITWGSETITFEYHYLLGREGFGESVEITGPQTLSIPVDGLAIQPIFDIDGTANNLTISANGYSFTLPNFTNTKWNIDFEKYIVLKDGQETMIDIREFYLMPGNNDVKITGNNINIDMRIKFRDKYM